MSPSDAELLARLDAILAGQQQQAGRLAGIETVLTQLVRSIDGLAQPLGMLQEAVVQLAQAAAAEATSEALTKALQGILDELGRQTTQIGVIAAGMERLPAIMAETAIAAADLVRSDGSPARATPNVPNGQGRAAP